MGGDKEVGAGRAQEWGANLDAVYCNVIREMIRPKGVKAPTSRTPTLARRRLDGAPAKMPGRGESQCRKQEGRKGDGNIGMVNPTTIPRPRKEAK